MHYLFAYRGWEVPPEPDQRRLSDQMIRYWGQFARTGDPNTGAQPRLPRMGPVDAKVLALTPGNSQLVDAAQRHNCHLWTSVRSASTPGNRS